MNDWSDAEQHIERAHDAYEAGRWDEAETELREALALNPYRSEWHFNLGLTLEAAGRYPDAAAAFRDAHELDPDSQGALLVGVNLLRAGQVKESIEWFEKAQKLDPEDPDPLVHRIEAYARMGDHEQAEVMFYMAQQVDPRNAMAYACLADSLLDRGLHDKAVWCLREAAQLDPGLPRVHARLAEAYAATGRLERARQLYLRELREDPGDIDTLLDLGCLLVDMNRLGEAGEKFRRVLELEPDNPSAHFYLGDLADRQGLIEQALAQFDVVLRLDPTLAGTRRRTARLLLDRGASGDAGAARELLQADLADQRENPEEFVPDDLDELGQLLLDAQMPVEARRVFQWLVKQRPGDAKALHHLSVAAYQMGDRAAGIELSRQVARLEPKFVPAMSNMAVAYVYDRQWTRARYWVRQAMLLDPDDAPLRRLRMKLRLHTLAEAAVWAAEGAAVLLRGMLRRR